MTTDPIDPAIVAAGIVAIMRESGCTLGDRDRCDIHGIRWDMKHNACPQAVWFAEVVTEAAAPMIAAKALRDEADRLEGMAYGCTGRYTDAGRHIIARIRDRADALEAGQS